MEITIRSIGNSKGVVLPQPLLAQAGLGDGTHADITATSTPRSAAKSRLDQLRVVDKRCLAKKLSQVTAKTLALILATLQAVFAE